MSRVLRNKSLLLLFLLACFSMLSMFMTNSVHTLFALELGATITELSLIGMFGGVISMIIQIPFGILSDRTGRKPMLIYTELVTVISVIMQSLSTQPWHLILASLFSGFSGGAFAPVIIALVGDISTPEDRADAISMWYLFSSIGMFVGPAISSVFLLFMPIRSILYIGSFLRILMFLMTVFGIKEVHKKQPKEGSFLENYKSSVTNLLRKPNAIIGVITRLAYTFFETVVRTYMPVLAKQEPLSLSNSLIASLGTFQGATRIGVRSILGKIIGKVGAKNLLILTLLGISTLGFLLSFTNSFYYLVLISLLYGLWQGIDSPLSSLLITDVSTSAERGFANAILYSSMSIGRITPIVMVPVIEGWGLLYVFPLGAILPIITVLVASKYMKPLSTEQGTEEEQKS